MYMPWLSTSVKVWQSTFFCLDTHDWKLRHVQFAPSHLTYVFFFSFSIIISVTWGLPRSFARPDREHDWFWQFIFFLSFIPLLHRGNKAVFDTNTMMTLLAFILDGSARWVKQDSRWVGAEDMKQRATDWNQAQAAAHMGPSELYRLTQHNR